MKPQIQPQPEYSHLRNLDVSFGQTYGPVQSKRLGLSLGVNPLGRVKACSFDCGYCDLGPSQLTMNQIKRDVNFPPPEEIVEEVRQRLRNLRENEQNVETLTLSGNGEPTLYPHLDKLVSELICARDELAPNSRLVILSNGAHLGSQKLIKALNKLDERMIKLDAGSEKIFKKINSPIVRAHLSRIITGTRQLQDCIIQSIFVRGIVDNTTNEHLEEWFEAIGMIQPKQVHLYTLERVPHISGLERVDEDFLDALAVRLRKKKHIHAKVFF